MNKRRVVVTGLGVVASNGIEKDQFWQANIQGKSGVGVIKNFDSSNYQTKIADVVLSNSFGFGSSNATLIFRRFK